jgi:hypothetical protein
MHNPDTGYCWHTSRTKKSITKTEHRKKIKDKKDRSHEKPNMNSGVREGKNVSFL